MKKFLLSTLAVIGMAGTAFAGTGTAADPFTVTEALAYINGGGSEDATMYTKGYITAISEVSTSYGNATYDIADQVGGSPSLIVYRGYYLNGDKFTAQDQIKVGDLVVVEGKLVNFKGNTPEYTTGSHIVSLNGTTEDPGTGGGSGNDQPSDPSTPQGTAVTFDFSDPSLYGLNPADAVKNALNLSGMTLKSGDVTILCESNDGVSTEIRFYSNENTGEWTFRFYKDTHFTVTAPAGNNLTGIVFNGYNIGTNWSYSNGTVQGNTWLPSGDVNSVTIGKTETGNNPTIKSMTVYYNADSGVEEILAADDSEAVYFDLQGRKVLNPERGIFVKMVNGKALKVVK